MASPPRSDLTSGSLLVLGRVLLAPIGRLVVLALPAPASGERLSRRG